MELQARVPLKFVAQYVSDRLSDAWNFEDEVCDGFYDWIMGFLLVESRTKPSL